MFVAAAATRGMLIPSEGDWLYCGDYASIESRVLNWIAGEDWALKAYREGADMYVLNAASTFSCQADKVNKDQRQVGKVEELALGYQGGENAFIAMAETYGMQSLVETTEADGRCVYLLIGGEKLPVKPLVKAWREAHPNVVRFWRQIENAAIAAVQSPGCITEYRGVLFRMWGRFLCLQLPSSRVLYYYDPRVTDKPMPWDKDVLKPSLSFMGVDSETKQWRRQDTYGGSLTENIVQAIARDICANGMLLTEQAGYRNLLSVHDEIVAERAIGTGSVEEFESLMCSLPGWAGGLPVEAEAWCGRRYRK
jgi:DNA polymerase